MRACTDTILARLQSADSFNTWKNTTSSQLNAISANAQAGTVPPSSTESDSFATLSADIFSTTSCIQSQISSLSGTSNNIHTIQQEILDINDELTKAEEEVNIARDRVKYIRHPEQNTSYYESWFPIDRPMHKANIPIFIGVILFVFIFSLILCLSIIGVDFDIEIHPTLYLNIQYILSQFTWLTALQTALLIYGIYYFMNRG